MTVYLHGTAYSASVEQAESKYTLNDINTDAKDNAFTITMVGSSAPAFTSRELYDPYRLIVDIAGLTFDKKLQISELIPKNKFVTLQTTVVKGLKPEITRFIFTIQDGYRQKVERKNSDLVINILPLAKAAKTVEAPQKSPSVMDSSSDNAGSKEESTDVSEKIKDLIASTAKNVGKGSDTTGNVADELTQGFDISGYKRERVSIDFYKIDLHNVFRLFRQVSGLNIIVAEGVSGSITLALNDVPWDFALDVILNLAELKKEERFNTIVIYPKAKEFEWPTRASDNLSFQANLEVVEQEALIIEQSANQPKEIMQAKELMRKGRLKEKDNNFEEAVDLYVEAAELWPVNSNLTTKIAAIYLVRLGMNAKGVFYAKKSLEIKPDNYKAALYAAIGLANMNKVKEAMEYFNQSISGTPPLKEALASFAAFSESSGKPAIALKLYDKYHEIYGESINTMVAKARIYDGLGMREKATEQYQTILSSGFQLPVGLKNYIENRVATAK